MSEVIQINLGLCVFSICYVLVLWLFVRVIGPNEGYAEVVIVDGKVVGALITFIILYFNIILTVFSKKDLSFE